MTNKRTGNGNSRSLRDDNKKKQKQKRILRPLTKDDNQKAIAIAIATAQRRKATADPYGMTTRTDNRESNGVSDFMWSLRAVWVSGGSLICP
jgi:hypothetical protein